MPMIRGTHQQERLIVDDVNEIHIRRWRPDTPASAQIIMLHGVVSHSEWLSAIAALLCDAGIDTICPDRRGTGLSTAAPGDAPDKSALVSDIAQIVEKCAENDKPMHLAGFCWGSIYAINCVEKMPNLFKSLVLLAPSLFPAEDLAQRDLISGSSGKASIPPLVPIDRFTQGPDYKNYIVPDPLRTRAVSPRFNRIMLEMQNMIGPRWAKLDTPTLTILAEDDRLSDNTKHERAFERLRAGQKRLVKVPGEHGLQFDAPAATCDAIAQWICELG